MSNTEQEVREQIAREVARAIDLATTGKWRIWEEMPEDARLYSEQYADQILNIKARRGGGECPECKNRRFFRIRWHGMAGISACPICHGIGVLPVVGKSIGDIVKEWEDEQNKH